MPPVLHRPPSNIEDTTDDVSQIKPTRSVIDENRSINVPCSQQFDEMNLPVRSQYLCVPHRSPSPSDFGDEYHQEDGLIFALPKNIVDYLDGEDLEAYAVPADGNCLFRALTFGPEWSKHDLARACTGSYIYGLKQEKNVLSGCADYEQVNKIMTGYLRLI
jgi:hypothetical protein